jgi:hypothetical protein
MSFLWNFYERLWIGQGESMESRLSFVAKM